MLLSTEKDGDSRGENICETDLRKCRLQAFCLFQIRQRPTAREDFAERVFCLLIFVEAETQRNEIKING